jgi:hypothetical protein
MERLKKNPETANDPVFSPAKNYLQLSYTNAVYEYSETCIYIYSYKENRATYEQVLN